MRTAFGTDVGRVRQLNEDRILVGTVPSGDVLAIVADGMGGHNAGEVASEMAVNAIAHYFQINPPDAQAHVRLEQLKMAVVTANAAVFGLAEQDASYKGMGTTVVAAMANPIEVCLAHVGDSRIYLLRNHELLLLTEDHNFANALLQSGQITVEEARSHPKRNHLVRVVGTDPHVKVDVQAISWLPGDVLLMCSDGLTNRLSDEQICASLNSDVPFDQKAGLLIQHACEAGGQDNISVILLQNDPEQETRERGTQS
jgi:serine/threonine protein phosphatase PrpC